MIWNELLCMEGSGDFFVVLLFISAMYLAQLKEEGVLTLYKIRVYVYFWYHVKLLLFKRALKRNNMMKVKKFRKHLKKLARHRICMAKRQQQVTVKEFHRNKAA